ncbi:MAG: acyltransferase, partial [Solirubrobacterales bacterium]|nr:acyltransferase [Solirubrobacterales bacterium]
MRRPALPARLALAVLVIAPAALGLGGTTSGTAAGPLPCLGAAARAPGRPCTNPALRTVVTPAPEDALLVPDAPCVPAAPEPGQDANLEVCAFGEPAGRARRTVALLGDSHASHWRAALAVAARTAGWRGLSLTKSSCPFSTADARIAVEAREPCRRHNVAVVAFLARHPEIAAVFVSAHAGARVFTQPGRSHLATKVVGYRGAWAALPASVRRIVVLRDVPVHPLRTTPCVEAALARHADGVVRSGCTGTSRSTT